MEYSSYGSSRDIHDNNLTSTSVGHSIDIEGSSSINCYKNTITKTGTNQKSGVGILYGGGCSGMVHENDISYCDWGIGAIWGAYPIAFSYSASAVNNRIINCNIGINVYRDSYAQFGSQYVFTSSHNSIYRNSSYNALVGWSYPTYSCGLYAMYNWWGSNNPNTLLFYTGPNAYFYYQPYIMQDPWEYAQNVAYKNDVNVISQQNEQSYKSVSADSNSLFYGMMLRSKGDYKAAKDFFISYLEKYPENQAAYVELYNCYTKDIANDLIKYFTSLPKEASKDHKLFLSYLYLKTG